MLKTAKTFRRFKKYSILSYNLRVIQRANATPASRRRTWIEDMNKKQFFWNLIRIRYGWPLTRLPAYYECGKQFNLMRALFYKKSGFITTHSVRNIASSLLSEICKNFRSTITATNWMENRKTPLQRANDAGGTRNFYTSCDVCNGKNWAWIFEILFAFVRIDKWEGRKKILLHG